MQKLRGHRPRLQLKCLSVYPVVQSQPERCRPELGFAHKVWGSRVSSSAEEETARTRRGGVGQEIDFLERTARRSAAPRLDQGGEFADPTLYVQSP